MDEDIARLVKELCSRAGSIMEDVSAEAILIDVSDARLLAMTISKLRDEVAKMAVILEAAAALL